MRCADHADRRAVIVVVISFLHGGQSCRWLEYVTPSSFENGLDVGKCGGRGDRLVVVIIIIASFAGVIVVVHVVRFR